jgi:glycosyltransferase involved in cell wall biosynthesis
LKGLLKEQELRTKSHRFDKDVGNGRADKGNLWLVCFRYGFGNWQHIESFTAQAEKNGFAVRLILSTCLSWMTGPFSNRATYVTRSDSTLSIILDTFLFFLYRWIILWRLLRRERPQAIILVMWHPLNAVFCVMAKLAAGSKTVAWLHEPYKENKAVYGAKAVVFYFVEWLQTLAIPWLDDIVVHSNTAFRAFRKRYPHARQALHIIPLQFQDKPAQQGNRRLVSFLGTTAKAKGIDAFFDLLESAALRNVHWQFAIATRDNINGRLEKMSPTARKKLQVVSTPRLSDTALREVASQSLVVLCLYSDSMQSGVVPLAFMCGTPVIATDIESLRESVEHRETGYFVPPAAKPDAILEGLTFIEKNFSTLSKNCRQKFLATYDDRNWINTYDWLWRNESYKSRDAFILSTKHQVFP